MQPKTIDKPNSYFSFKDEQVTFKQNRLSGKYQILPFATKVDKNLIKSLKRDFIDFNGVIGEIFRDCNSCQFSSSILKDNNFKSILKKQILDQVKTTVQIDEKDELKEILEEKLTDIIDSLYFRNNDFIKFSKEAMSMLNFGHPHARMNSIASFIIDVFINNNNQKFFLNKKGQHPHLLDKLVIESLPKLESRQKNRKATNYAVENGHLMPLFDKDLQLLSADKQNFLNNISLLVKHYYYLYICSFSVRLNSFFSEEEEIAFYFTLDSERYSESRKANQKGWKSLEPKITNLFSHAICLDLIHHINVFKQSQNYIDIKNTFEGLSAANQEQAINDIKWLLSTYISSSPPLKNKDWREFEDYYPNKIYYNKAIGDFEKEIIKLWSAIDFQFLYSERKSKYLGYAVWFKEFCKVNLLKFRGRYGFSLNMETDNLLFLIKLSIGKNEKIRLKDLWLELEDRGILFDNTSKKEVVNFLEKINLIEKKSDSGDAQYVKAIL